MEEEREGMMEGEREIKEGRERGKRKMNPR